MTNRHRLSTSPRRAQPLRGSFVSSRVAADLSGLSEDEITALVAAGQVDHDTIRDAVFVSLDACQRIGRERGVMT